MSRRPDPGVQRRLDNLVYRAGLATTRAQARQLVCLATIPVHQLWAANEFADPRTCEGVIAVAEWAVTAVLPTCVALARSGMDLDRVSVVQKSAAKLGKMRDKALRCEQALLVREDRRGTAVDVLAPEPPVHDPIATLAWAYMALAKAIYDMTRDAHFRAKKYTIMTDACAAVGYVPPNSAIDAILDEFDPPRRKGA